MLLPVISCVAVMPSISPIDRSMTDDIGIESLCKGNRLAPVRRLSDYLNVLRRAEYCLHSGSNYRMVVSQDHLDYVDRHDATLIVRSSALTLIPPVGELSMFILPPASNTRSFTDMSPGRIPASLGLPLSSTTSI